MDEVDKRNKSEAEPAEHLVDIKLEDGSAISFFRTKEKEVIITHGDREASLGKASAQQTLDLLALLEPLGSIEGDPNART